MSTDQSPQSSPPAVAGMAGLDVQGVRKSFGSVAVLRDVGLTLAPAEFATLLGPSGCGKTTLLRIVAGLEVADAGEVHLFGRDLTRLPANRRPVNTVFQSYALFPHLSVFENVAFGLRSRNVPAGELRRRVDDAMAMLRIDDLAARMPHQLSGGQKQRVAVARALVNEPELLLLDEPLSALDAKLRVEVQVELRRLQKRTGKTFLLVTHDQDEAMAVSDRIFVMRAGRIEQAGTPTDVYEHPVSRFVAGFLGSANLIDATLDAAPAQTPHHAGTARTAFGTLTLDRIPARTRATLAIRPERVQISAGKPLTNGVQAIVQEVIYRGDHVDVFVTPGPLRVRAHPSTLVSVGDSVWLHLPAEHLEVLDD